MSIGSLKRASGHGKTEHELTTQSVSPYGTGGYKMVVVHYSSIVEFIATCSCSINEYKDMMKAQVHVTQVFRYSDTQRLPRSQVFKMMHSKGDCSLAFKTKLSMSMLVQKSQVHKKVKDHKMMKR
ncbi:hypothetical protein Tco_0566085 [Tanacetum coccineum]